MSEPVPLFGGEDPRYDELFYATIEVVRERGSGLILAGVLGVLRLVEDQLIREQRES